MSLMSSQIFKAERGVCSAVFKTMVLPQASAGPNFQANMSAGLKIAETLSVTRVRLEEGSCYTQVPWDDLSDDTDRLVTGVSHLCVVDLDDLSVVLVGPAGIVAKAASDFGDIKALCDREGLSVVHGLGAESAM